MDPDDPISIIFRKIKTLEPVNARIIIGHFLSQNMEKVDLIRIAFGPDALVQTLCQKALSDLGLSSNSFSRNSISRPSNVHHHQPLPQSSPRNGLLGLPRNPNALSPSLTSATNANFDSGPFRDGYYVDEQQLSNQFSFLNDGNPHANLHKRSFSANDACPESEKPGFGGLVGYQFPQSCLVDDFGSSGGFRSASERQREEMMRMNFLTQKQFGKRQGSGGQFGEDGGQSRHERDVSVSRLIYLRFPSESTFTQEDVFSYFSDFGTVDYVRIPRQQERVFGFVSFANAETVRTILAQGNLHIICDSVVHVKPYKDKSERQQELIERGPRMMRSKTDSQLAKEAELQLPERENESIEHPQPSLSLDSLADFPPLQLQPERNTQGGSHLQVVANRNEGNNGQGTTLENTLPDKINKAASSDQQPSSNGLTIGRKKD